MEMVEGASYLTQACNELLSHAQTQNYTYDAVFLKTAIEKILNDPRIDLLSVLAPRHDDPGNDDYNEVIELIGCCSIVFKQLLESDEETFSYYITSFCKHLERSNCILHPKLVEKSAYMYLLSEYVRFMMPLDDHHLTHPVCELREEDRASVGYKSPLNLFKDDALRQYTLSPSRSLRALHTISRAISPHFLTFICILVRSYCALNSWPTEYRLMALRYVLKQIHVFTLAETVNLTLSQLKTQLQWNAPFTDALYDFLFSLFTRWPPNQLISSLFDVWITWIRPWRYCNNNLHRVMPYIRANRRFYVDLSVAFWSRNFPINSPHDVFEISTYIELLTSPEMLKIYEELDYDVEVNILNLFLSIQRSAKELHLEILATENRLKKTNWFRRTFLCEEEEQRLSSFYETLNSLDALIERINSARLDDNQISNGSKFQEYTPSLDYSLSPKSEPDHIVDPSTKRMILTPLGRRQIADRSHCFDYSRCRLGVPPIAAPLRSDEVWWLSTLLYRISRQLNRLNFIQAMSRSYDNNSLLGFIARLVLEPEYPNVPVPADSREIIVQKPCINLRYLSRYHFLIPFAIFTVLSLLLPFTYSFIAFMSMLLYARLLR